MNTKQTDPLSSSIEEAIEVLGNLVADLEEANKHEWGTSLQVDNGKPTIAIHGINDEVCGTESFERVVNEFIDSDDDWLLEMAPVWIDKLKWSIDAINDAITKINTR